MTSRFPAAASRGFPGFHSPGAGFEAPFAMLEACHERVHRTLDLLVRLQAHMQGHGADDQARQAASDVLRYFDIAAPLHHQDEELHVFPLLLQSSDAETVNLVSRLQQQHSEMEQRWESVRGKLQGGVLLSQEEVRSFVSLYSEHIALEEQVAYPKAIERMSPAVLSSMGKEMSARRTVAASDTT
jgi:iron-sulfur cluster repair protein YtfE (RIC family)